MAVDMTIPPSWLNKEFVETVLKENEDPSITVQDVTVELAVGKGENYMSQLHRVGVDFTKGGRSEHRSLIVKSVPPIEFLAKVITEDGFFDREIRMYEETLPALFNLEATATGCKAKPFVARYYKTSRPYTLVMDDLVQKGFKMAERHRGLDLRRSKIALEAFARLHALSVALEAKDPASMQHYGEPFHDEAHREKNTQFMMPMINILANNVEKWEGFARFGEKLRKIDWVDVAIQLAKRKDGDVAVLNHGDGWTNNMLFQCDDAGEITALAFVDFQITRFSSPAMDLQYFMYTSPSEETRENHWDELIQHYYETFVQILKNVDCESKAFTFEKLKQEVHDKTLFGIFTACTILPIVLVDPEDAPDMSGVTEENVQENLEASNIDKSYNSKRFRKVFGNILLKIEEMGLI